MSKVAIIHLTPKVVVVSGIWVFLHPGATPFLKPLQGRLLQNIRVQIWSQEIF